MRKVSYRIQDMDCAEEVATLKGALAPLVPDEEALSFDLLNRRLTVSLPDTGVSEEDLRVAIARTGMSALPWLEDDAIRPRSPWRRGQAVSCAASGALLLTGFVSHALSHGLWDAISGGTGGDCALPGLSKFCYVLAALSGAWFVSPKAVFAARQFRPDMNLLMLVAMAGAMGLGEWSEAGTVSFLFAFALLLESWSVSRARRAIERLMDLSPPTARFLSPETGEVVERSVEEVPVDAIVRVRPGERIPLDGVVTRGATSVNQAPITGESVPVTKDPGSEVFAGTINHEGAFEFRVTRCASDTVLSHIIHLVEEAQSRRAPVERWVEAFARYYTPAMMALALVLAVVVPLAAGEPWATWFYRALVLLVIACPCALVISTPVSIVAGLTAAARAGVLIKGGAFLEAPSRLRVVALDKTGTLTTGKPRVQEVIPFDNHTSEQLLAKAAALESHSEHPIAHAILERAKAEGVRFEAAETFQSLRGKGAEAVIGGRTFWLGSHRFMHEKGLETPEFHQKAEELEKAGYSVVAIGTDDHVCGLISVADAVRDGAPEVVRELRNSGIARVVMLTGDHATSAARVAEATGVDEIYADLLPEDKVREIERLVQQHGHVAMVGDGVNDAPAMAASSLGIAMGAAGSDAAIDTADVALMSDDLTRLPWLIRHSGRTLQVIRQNVVLALGIKVIVLGLAVAGYASLWMAIAADMGASLVVIFNALRLLGQERRAT